MNFDLSTWINSVATYWKKEDGGFAGGEDSGQAAGMKNSVLDMVSLRSLLDIQETFLSKHLDIWI